MGASERHGCRGLIQPGMMRALVPLLLLFLCHHLGLSRTMCRAQAHTQEDGIRTVQALINANFSWEPPSWREALHTQEPRLLLAKTWEPPEPINGSAAAAGAQIPITVFTALSLERLGQLQLLCNSWPGPMVAAVWLPIVLTSDTEPVDMGYYQRQFNQFEEELVAEDKRKAASRRSKRRSSRQKDARGNSTSSSGGASAGNDSQQQTADSGSSSSKRRKRRSRSSSGGGGSQDKVSSKATASMSKAGPTTSSKARQPDSTLQSQLDRLQQVLQELQSARGEPQKQKQRASHRRSARQLLHLVEGAPAAARQQLDSAVEAVEALVAKINQSRKLTPEMQFFRAQALRLAATSTSDAARARSLAADATAAAANLTSGSLAGSGLRGMDARSHRLAGGSSNSSGDDGGSQQADSGGNSSLQHASGGSSSGSGGVGHLIGADSNITSSSGDGGNGSSVLGTLGGQSGLLKSAFIARSSYLKGRNKDFAHRSIRRGDTGATADATSPFAGAELLGSLPACQLTVLLFVQVFRDPVAPLFLFPINSLRNYASLRARTPLVSMVDVDLTFNSRFTSSLLTNPDRAADLVKDAASGSLLVPPAFEAPLCRQAQCRDGMAAGKVASYCTKQQLGALLNKGWLDTFHCSKGTHWLVDYKRWFETMTPYEVRYARGAEPWYIGHKALVPWYDTRLKGYGFNKQVQLLYATGNMRMRIRVLPDAWLIHIPHRHTAVSHAFKAKGLMQAPAQTAASPHLTWSSSSGGHPRLNASSRLNLTWPRNTSLAAAWLFNNTPAWRGGNDRATQGGAMLPHRDGPSDPGGINAALNKTALSQTAGDSQTGRSGQQQRYESHAGDTVLAGAGAAGSGGAGTAAAARCGGRLGCGSGQGEASRLSAWWGQAWEWVCNVARRCFTALRQPQVQESAPLVQQSGQQEQQQRNTIAQPGNSSISQHGVVAQGAHAGDAGQPSGTRRLLSEASRLQPMRTQRPESTTTPGLDTLWQEARDTPWGSQQPSNSDASEGQGSGNQAQEGMEDEQQRPGGGSRGLHATNAFNANVAINELLLALYARMFSAYTWPLGRSLLNAEYENRLPEGEHPVVDDVMKRLAAELPWWSNYTSRWHEGQPSAVRPPYLDPPAKAAWPLAIVKQLRAKLEMCSPALTPPASNRTPTNATNATGW